MGTVLRTLVDACGAHENAYGWHAYLDDTFDVPFEAQCSAERDEFLLKKDETVRVVGTSSTEPTLSQIHVTVEWMDRELGVPLAQLEAVDASDDTEQAIAIWLKHWWAIHSPVVP